MLLLNVRYTVKSGMRKEFYDAVMSAGIAKASQQEYGNCKYEYSFSEAEEDVLLLEEIWLDEDTQKTHTQTDHFKQLGALKEKYVVDTDIEKREFMPNGPEGRLMMKMAMEKGDKVSLLKGSRQRWTFRAKFNENVARIGGLIVLVVILYMYFFK